MNEPKLKDLKRDPFLQEEWKVCPTCQGGRGQVVEIETLRNGEPVREFKVIVCRRCSGTKVVSRFPDPQ